MRSLFLQLLGKLIKNFPVLRGYTGAFVVGFSAVTAPYIGLTGKAPSGEIISFAVCAGMASIQQRSSDTPKPK